MISVELTYEVNALREAIRQYGTVSNKTEGEIIEKQSAKLGVNIRMGLKALAPGKGVVRAERLAALKSGEGVHVRPGVYQELRAKFGDMTSVSQKFKGPNNELAGSGFSARRTMNFQALAVQRELSLRESGRGFMAWSTPRYRSQAELAHLETFGRYNKMLSSFDIDVRPDAKRKFATFTWDAKSPALEGLSEPQQIGILEDAIRITTADIEVYVERKLEENATKAHLE